MCKKLRQIGQVMSISIRGPYLVYIVNMDQRYRLLAILFNEKVDTPIFLHIVT